MTHQLFTAAVFVAGLSLGWFGKSWLATGPSLSATPSASQTTDGTTALPRSLTAPPTPEQPTPAAGSLADRRQADSGDPLQFNSTTTATSASLRNTFRRMLDDGRYIEAINLYQEQQKQNSSIANRLKTTLLTQLEQLTQTRRYDDFSALINQYLSVYYDDVEVLLLQADFNQANGHYLQVIDGYLLAKTYAYAAIDQQKVVKRFDSFVEDIDRWYSQQQNWPSLISFYSYINTSGLMTSSHQYRLAIAHLANGETDFAIAQLNILLSDNTIGRAAAQALDELDKHSVATLIDNSPASDHSESIALQKTGNQFAATVTNHRQQKLNLLLDTGASMTAITSASFHSLGISADAVEQGRRVFRTAGGVVMGTVYTIEDLQLGPYPLKNTQIAVIDFPTRPGIDGLLGMNILGQFQFQIDQQNSLLLLSDK